MSDKIYDFNNNEVFKILDPGSLIQLIETKQEDVKEFEGSYILRIQDLRLISSNNIIGINIHTGGAWSSVHNFKFKIIKSK